MNRVKGRFVVEHETTGETLQRFFSKVMITNTCWQWLGSKQRYAIFYNKKNIYAHRYSYEVFKGELLNDKVIDHLCANKFCVNPEHLEQVTQKINTLRCSTAPATINSKKTHCPKGHKYNTNSTWLSKHGKRHCKKCWQ